MLATRPSHLAPRVEAARAALCRKRSLKRIPGVTFEALAAQGIPKRSTWGWTPSGCERAEEPGALWVCGKQSVDPDLLWPRRVGGGSSTSCAGTCRSQFLKVLIGINCEESCLQP